MDRGRTGPDVDVASEFLINIIGRRVLDHKLSGAQRCELGVQFGGDRGGAHSARESLLDLSLVVGRETGRDKRPQCQAHNSALYKCTVRVC